MSSSYYTSRTFWLGVAERALNASTAGTGRLW